MRCIKYQRLMEATFVTPQLHQINSSVNKNDKTSQAGKSDWVMDTPFV